MRLLDFTVSGQSIKPDHRCDFSGLVAGSRGYLFARFSFNAKDWSGCKKVAVFCSNGREYPVAVTGGQCEIPADALTGSAVQVYVVGRRPGYEIETNKTAFPQTVRR